MCTSHPSSDTPAIYPSVSGRISGRGCETATDLLRDRPAERWCVGIGSAATVAFETQHRGGHRSRRPERGGGKAGHDPRAINAGPPSGSMTATGRPTRPGVGGHDQIGADHPTPRTDQATQQGGGDPEGWVGDYSELPLRQAKVACVGLDNHDRGAESLTEPARPLRVQLDSDHPSTRRQQLGGYRPAAGTDVKDQVARPELGATDETPSPKIREFVISPPVPPFGGHGAPLSLS